MKGSCLCGAVCFEVSGEICSLYQCHCSLCQKQSGSTSNTATVVKSDDFAWLSNSTANITRWQKPTGFSSHFCKTCGSPVPNPLREHYYWIPMGLIEERKTHPTIDHHLNCKSKAGWDRIPETESMYEDMPDSLDAFLGNLMKKTK